MTLLVLLSWFLLLLSIILSGMVLLSKLLQERRSKVAKCTSWIAVALGCLAVLVVVITTGYLGMRMRPRAVDGEPCGEFGLKDNPETNLENVPDVVLVLNYFLTNFPEAGKWASWVAAGLCGLAVLAFVICVALLLRDDSKKVPSGIPHLNFEYVKQGIDQPHCIDKDDGKEATVLYGKYIKLTSASGVFKQKKSRSHMWAGYASLGLLSAALIGVILLNYYFGAEEEEIQLPCLAFDHHQPYELQDKNFISSIKPQNHPFVQLPRRLFLVSREGWLAAPPRSTKVLRHPVEHVVVSYTNRGSCSSHSECAEAIRSLQASDMEVEGWWDIAHNFLVAGDDRIYEGRGWDVEGLQNGRYDNGSLGVSFVGTFMHQLPPPYQMRAFKQLVEEGTRIGKISPSYKLVTDRKANGSLLSKELQTWDHWVWQS